MIEQLDARIATAKGLMDEGTPQPRSQERKKSAAGSLRRPRRSTSSAARCFC